MQNDSDSAMSRFRADFNRLFKPAVRGMAKMAETPRPYGFDENGMEIFAPRGRGPEEASMAEIRARSREALAKADGYGRALSDLSLRLAALKKSFAV
jgi:hypothetical protein